MKVKSLEMLEKAMEFIFVMTKIKGTTTSTRECGRVI